MQQDSDHPWIFHRDEIDLLEEDIDEIFQRFQKKEDFQIENYVIKEQMETEELSDVEFTLRMSQELFEGKPQADPGFQLDKQFEIQKPHTNQPKRNPLYERSFYWSQEVFAFAKNLYEQNAERTQDVFRVYFNVKFIPIKLSIMHVDELNDRFSLDIAEKEFELALVYVKRVLASIAALVYFDKIAVLKFLEEGEKIKIMVEETLAVIKKRKQNRPDRFL